MTFILFFIFCFFIYLIFKPSDTITTIDVAPTPTILPDFLAMKKEYLTTSTWKNKRARVLARDHHRCTSCGSYLNLTVHHDYGYHLIPHESIECLRTLCRRCHTAFHHKHGFPQTLHDYYTWDTRGIPFKHPLTKVTYEQDN